MDTVDIRDVKQGEVIWWNQHGQCEQYTAFSDVEDDGEKLILYVMAMDNARTAMFIWNYTNNAGYTLPIYKENPCG